MKKLAIVLALVLCAGCITGATLDVKAQIYLNEIDGWLGTIEVLIKEYDESGDSSELFDKIVFAYNIVKPQIVSTLKNIALIKQLTAEQSEQLEDFSERIDAINKAVE